MGVFGVWGQSVKAQKDTGQHPVVIELFTSQSCSSCPAADKVLGELVRENKNIIALSCHVTYWDHLSWKDTLSKPECTQRQYDYAEALGNGRRVYTPQMVVNGTENFVGSSRSKAKKALSGAHKILPISLSHLDERTVNVQLPTLPGGAYKLQIFGYKSNHQEDVKRGENRGKHLRYTNSVTAIGTPQDWDGSAAERALSLPESHRDGITVLAQSLENGAIFAAGQISTQ